MWPPRRDTRGLSPVVGVTLLVAIVVVLSAVAAGLFLGLAPEREPPPEVVLDMERDAGEPLAEHWIRHEAGGVLDVDRVELRGAATPDGFSDDEWAAGQRQRIYPTDTTVRVVWVESRRSSHVLAAYEVDADETVPEPDKGCDWVDDETNGGSDNAKLQGEVVACDVETQDLVEVQSGSVVIGDSLSHASTIEGDNAVFYGDATADGVVNLQDSTLAGSATSATDDVKLTNGTVGGDATGGKVVELLDGSSVGGDASSDTKVVKVQDGSRVGGDAVSDADEVKVLDSEVEGSVAGETVTLDGATVGGDVYVDPGDFSCADSTIDGQDCGSYSPEDPDDY